MLPLADRYHSPHPAPELDDPAARLTVCERLVAAGHALAEDADARVARAGGLWDLLERGV